MNRSALERARKDNQELSKKLDELVSLVKTQNEASLQMKQQVQSLSLAAEKTNNDLKGLGEELSSLKRTVTALAEKQPESRDALKRQAKKPKLSKELSLFVRDIHDSLVVKFDGSQLFNSPHNKQVSGEIQKQVLHEVESGSSTYRSDEVNRAVHRYYESRRRLFNDSQPNRVSIVEQNKKNAKKKAFQKRLYDRRAKVLVTNKEKEYWSSIDENFMTEESEDEDEDVVRRHQLQWCSHALQSLKQLLDSRLRSAGVVSGRYMQKSRIDGAASSSPVVSGSPSWAVKRSLQNSDTAAAPMRNITNTISAPTTPTTRHNQNSDTAAAPMRNITNTISAPTTPTTRHNQNSDTAAAPMRNITNTISAPTTPTTRHNQPGLMRRDQCNYQHSSSFQSIDQLRQANLNNDRSAPVLRSYSTSLSDHGHSTSQFNQSTPDHSDVSTPVELSSVASDSPSSDSEEEWERQLNLQDS